MVFIGWLVPIVYEYLSSPRYFWVIGGDRWGSKHDDRNRSGGKTPRPARALSRRRRRRRWGARHLSERPEAGAASADDVATSQHLRGETNGDICVDDDAQPPSAHFLPLVGVLRDVVNDEKSSRCEKALRGGELLCRPMLTDAFLRKEMSILRSSGLRGLKVNEAKRMKPRPKRRLDVEMWTLTSRPELESYF